MARFFARNTVVLLVFWALTVVSAANAEEPQKARRRRRGGALRAARRRVHHTNPQSMTRTRLTSTMNDTEKKFAVFFPHRETVCDATKGCWPTTWILGCQKCGSSAVALALNAYLGVCWAELRGVNAGKSLYFRKETHYWDDADDGNKVEDKSAEEFTALFPASAEKECGGYMDGTPNYFPEIPRVPDAIRRHMPLSVRPLVRFVLVLREPVARDLSSYNHQRAYGEAWSVGSCPATRHDTYESYADCQLRLYADIFLNETTSTSSSSSSSSVVEDDSARLDRVHWELHPTVWTSLYVLQLDAWTLRFPRSQFFIAEYDALFGKGTVDLDPMRAFLGLGSPLRRLPPPSSTPRDTTTLALVEASSSSRLVDTSAVVVPKENEQDRADKQKVIACATRDRLQTEIYDAWNARLYARLAEDHRRGLAPPEETSPFPPFRRDAVPCYSTPP